MTGNRKKERDMARYVFLFLACVAPLLTGPAMADDLTEVVPDSSLEETAPPDIDRWVARCVEICAPNKDAEDGGWHECCQAGCDTYMRAFLDLGEQLDQATDCQGAAMRTASPCIAPPMSLCSWMWKYACQSARDTAEEYCRFSLGIE